jgi:type I restriction-modification system DNA methylase subunit
MATFISLAETASFLGVSKETLRNWDKAGKLKSVRRPNNNYRVYSLTEVQRMVAKQPEAVYRENASLFEETFISATNDSDIGSQDKDLKRALARVHRALRDTDGNSSIVERFDETTKLIFLKLLSERALATSSDAFVQTNDEQPHTYAKRIREAFEKAAAANPKLFPEKFRTLRLSDAALATVGYILANVELRASSQDLKGYAYEEMIRNTFDKGDHQQFFTPQPIVEFLVSALGDRLKGTVCDPASGTGGFLVEVTKEKCPYKSLVAFEIDERLAWVSGINLFVHGATQVECRCIPAGGTLGKEGKSFFRKFDAIITNPPFGSDFNDRNELDSYILGKGKVSRRRGILFIERCLDMLKEGGWLGIVIDEGVLSLPSAADVRELILQRSEVVAVFSLPETAFLPYASVNTSILLLKKNSKPPQRQTTFYARAENIGRKANGEADLLYDDTGAPRPNSDLPEILRAWRQFEAKGQLQDQTDNVFLANPHALDVVSGSLDNRLDFRFHHPARIAAQLALEQCEYRLIQLGELCDIRNESYVPSIDFSDQAILYTGLANIESRTGHCYQIATPANALTSGVKKYYRGDVLFAKMRPNLRKIAYVEFETPGFASAECVVLTVRKDSSGLPVIDPFLFSILLRSDYTYGQIIHIIAGIGRPRIALKDLLTVRIPVPPLKDQKLLRDAFIGAKHSYESLRVKARTLTESASLMELQAIEGVARGFISKAQKS